MAYSVPMALVDFIPVLLFLTAAVILQRDFYGEMQKGQFALFAAGTIDVCFAGGLKALYKLLYAAGVCNFVKLSEMFFPLQSIGFLLAGLGLLAAVCRKKKQTVLNSAAPAVFTGTFIFVSLMVLGLGMMDFALALSGKRKGKKAVIPVLMVSFVCCLTMGYLSSKDFEKASMNWIAEGVNIVGQGTFLLGTLMLHGAKKQEAKG